MSYDDTFRISVHAVITDNDSRVLQLWATYNNGFWGLPGGSLEPGETVDQALIRECREELGIDIKIKYLSGIYYHKKHNSHAIIFRCELANDPIVLSPEHSEYKYFPIDELSDVQKQRVGDCLNYDGLLKTTVFE